jgi:predicted transposase YdaD
MKKGQTPHDVLFRYVFGQRRHAASLFARTLPRALARAIDWGTLARDDTTIVDRKLRRRCTDLLFAARFRRRRARLFVLPEHLSSPESFAVFKLAGYSVRIGERFCIDHPRRKRLPLVVAVVVHHGEKPYRGPRWRASRCCS